jgi:hypothetical protein
MPVEYVGHTTDYVSSGVNSRTISHAVPEGYDRLLLVSVMTLGNESVSSMTYGGAAMTLAKKVDAGVATGCSVEIWYMVNPAVGTANVVVNFATSVDPSYYVCSNLRYVDQATPIPSTDGDFASDTQIASDTIVTTVASSLVLAAAAFYGGDTDPFTPLTNNTERWDAATGTSTTTDIGTWGGTRQTLPPNGYLMGCQAAVADDWAIAIVEIAWDGVYGVMLSDTGAGAEAPWHDEHPLEDTGVGVDVVSRGPGDDSGAGADTIAVQVRIGLSDSGAGAEAIGGTFHRVIAETSEGTESIERLVGSRQYAGDDSLGVEYHETKIHPHKVKWYMAVKIPRIVWKGRVASDRGVEEGGHISIDMTIYTSSGGNVGSFDVNNFLPDLTVWVGTTDGDSDHGRCRLRHFDGADLHVSADMSCFWKVGDYISITDLHEFWPRPNWVEKNGETITILKDMDEDAPTYKFEYPVPVMGPPACAFIDPDTGKATVKFFGGRSYLVQTDSEEYWQLGWVDQGISSWAWWLEGADSPTPSGKGVTAQYSTPGQYVARLTVTGNNGKTERGFRNVFIFNRTGADAPLTQFNIERLSGSLSNNGWEAEVEIFDTAYDPDVVPDKSQAVLFAEEWFGGSPRESIYGNNYLHGRENIKMVGWLSQTSLSYAEDGVRTCRMNMRGLQEYIKAFSNYPVYFTTIEVDAPPWSKFGFDVGNKIAFTVRKCLYHLVRWHWTLLNFVDFIMPDDHNNEMLAQNWDEGTLASWLDEFTKDIQARWVVDCGGGLIIFSWPNWLPITGGGVVWRTRYYHDNVLNEDDFESLEIEHRITMETARVRVEGVMVSASGWWRVAQDTVPGDIRGYAGETYVVGNQVIGTGGFEGSQGFELARMIYAERSRSIESIRLVMCGNYPQFDITPEASYFKLSLKNTQEFRGVSWSLKPFWVTDIGYEIDVSNGSVKTSITAIPETMQDPFIPTYSQYDDLGKQANPAPAGGPYSFRSLQAAIDRADVRLLPAVIAGPATSKGQVKIQVYGEPPHYTVASNRLVKAIPGRPVTVEKRTNEDRTGRPGAASYEVVNLGQYYGEQADEYEPGYITRVAVMCIAGEIVEEDEIAFPLTVMGSPLKALGVKVQCKAAGSGQSTFEVTMNGQVITTINLGPGGEESELDLVAEWALKDGDELNVNCTVAGGCEDLVVSVECREYGL